MDVLHRTVRGRSDSVSLERGDLEFARQASAETQCFAELYRRHVARVYHYVLVRVRDVQAAQDLTSQIFLAALEAIGNYQGRGTLAAWLFGIAQHQIASYFRGHRVDLPLDDAQYVLCSDPAMEDTVEERLKLERVAEELGRIAPDRAEALALRLFGGLSAAEASELLGKSEAAVKMLVHRAVGDLQARLGGEEDTQ